MLPEVFVAALALGATGKVVHCSVPTVPIPSQAEYVAGVTGKVAPTLTVVFRTRPSSDQAESVLRVCIAALAKTVRIDGELLANAWYNPSAGGSYESDEGPLPLRDGSRHLSFDPTTGRIRTWNEREGIRPSTRDDPKGQYFTEYTERSVLVRPYGKYASVDVVFHKAPSEAEAVAALITEIKRVVQGQAKRLSTSAYAKLGSRADRVAQQQIRGSNGKYIVVEFDPKTGEIRSLDGRILDSMR